MDKSAVEFEAVAWATNGTKPSLNDAPPRLTAEIVSPKGHLQFEGTFVASRVESVDARYVILEAKSANTFEIGEDTYSACIYQAFKTDLKIDPAAWRGCDGPPYLMCRAVILERYHGKPFWGWEVNQPTPGDGWHLVYGQNVERLVAPANDWTNEIQYELLPRLRTRIIQVPQVLQRCERILRAQGAQSCFACFPESLGTFH